MTSLGYNESNHSKDHNRIKQNTKNAIMEICFIYYGKKSKSRKSKKILFIVGTL